MARAAEGDVKIHKSVWRRLEPRSMTFVHVIINYKSFSAWCVTTGWVNPLKCVIHQCVVGQGSPFEKKN